MIRNISRPIVVIVTLGLMTGCTIEPEKITKLERVEEAKQMLDKLHVVDQQQLQINLRQAIALAIENNLEYRVKKVQSALAYKQYDLAKTELYPNIDLSYDYNHRNRDYIKTLGDVAGGSSDAQSLIPHSIKTGNITFNWDILDFGLSYVRAKQAADRYLLSQEQRKQMAAMIINDVIKNYTLAYYGQELAEQLQEVKSNVEQALEATDKALEQGVGDNQAMLGYKKTLLEDYREARDYLTYFNQSRDKLLNLINYNSKTTLEQVPLKLAKPDDYLLKLPSIESSLLFLDTIALFFRPELGQAIYKVRETERQKSVALLEKLPSFGFNLGYNYDSDKFLKFQNWWSDNISLAWNLLHMATIPAALDTVETQLEAAKLTQLASSAVILGELRVLLYNYKMKKYDYLLSEKQSEFANNIYNHGLNLVTSGLGDERALVGDKLVAINSELSKLRTFVDARNLFEDVVLALGLYNYGGEFVNKGSVDFGIVNKWIDNFNTKDFDTLINDEYIAINTAFDLEANSNFHKNAAEDQGEQQHKVEPRGNNSEQKLKTSEPKHDEHARLSVNLPMKNKVATGYNKLAVRIGGYLTNLFSNAV